MINLVIGIVLLALTVYLFMQVIPKEGRPSRIPDKWGLPTAVSIAVLCLGVTAIVFVAKGMFP
jgi:hypothetical protein